MRRGRSRIPVLAKVAGPPQGARAWSLRRGDLTGLEKALPQLAEQRVVLVSGEGEAPTVAALAMASAAAAAGRRTVLVECDLAHPRLAAHVGLAPAPGLHEYLRWEAEPAELLQPVMLGGPAASLAADPLVCICGGRPASKTETLLGLQSFAHMVEKLRKAYELVVLAGASAVDEPSSCLAAARQADAVIAGLPSSAADGRAGRLVRVAVKRLGIPALGTIVVGGD
jgi:polysaccharide biosynthesis transport protein